MYSLFNITCREEWEWIHKASVCDQSQAPDDFRNQLTAACKHLLRKMGKYRPVGEGLWSGCDGLCRTLSSSCRL